MATTTAKCFALNSPSIIILTGHRSLPSSPKTNHKNSFSLGQPHRFNFNPITCSSTTNNSNNDDADVANSNSVQSAPASDGVGVKFRRRSSSRRQSKQNGAAAAAMQSAATRGKVASAPKKWEDMSFTEKAMELYVGERGALFWLNKFAYASIFIMIAAWIAFRFVGPALNLYQLDAPPLSPSDVLKGSSPS